MTYHQLALTLDAATPGPKPKPLPPTSYKMLLGRKVYNCTECMASHSVIERLGIFQCAHCGQKFYQTELPLRFSPPLTG